VIDALKTSAGELLATAQDLGDKLADVDGNVVPPLTVAQSLVEVTKLQQKLAKLAATFSGFLPFDGEQPKPRRRRGQG
jgi:hypothetical protein